MFRLVADVERYPEFLPWCLATRIKERDGDVLTADTIIGFKCFEKIHVARGTDRARLINVTYSKDRLNTSITTGFSPLDGGGIDFMSILNSNRKFPEGYRRGFQRSRSNHGSGV